MHPRAKLRAAMAQLARLAEWYVAALPEALTYVSPPAPPQPPQFPELPQLPHFPHGLFGPRRRASPCQRAPLPGVPHGARPGAAPTVVAVPGPSPPATLREQSRPSSSQQRRKQRRSARWRGGSARSALLGPRFFLIQRHLLAMQERRERLKQRALAKKQQQPRRAVSALPILDARALELEEEPVEEPPPPMECQLTLCPPLSLGDAPALPRGPVAAGTATPGQGGDSLRRSSSRAASSSLALLSAATLTPSASSRHSPSVPRVGHRHRRKPTHSPSRERADATGGYSSDRLAAYAPDPRASDAYEPKTHLRLHRVSRASRNEAKAGEFLAAAQDPELADVQSNNAAETALKVLGAVLVLSPANSGTENASEATDAAAHLLIDSSHRSKFLSGMQVKQRGRDSYSQNLDNSTADEISIKFVSTTIASSVTISSENTDSNSTDIPLVAITRHSLKMDSFNQHPAEVRSDQPDFMVTDTSSFAVSCNELRTVMPSTRRTEKSIFNRSNTTQISDVKTSFLKEHRGAHYTDKNHRKLDQKASREFAMLYASMGKRHASKTSESKRQQCFNQLTSLPLAKMNKKNSNSYSLRQSHALAQFLPLDEEPTPTQNDKFLHLCPLTNKTPSHLKNASDRTITDACQGNYTSAVETSRLCASLHLNFSGPSHSRLNGTDWNSSYSSEMLSHQVSTASTSTAVGNQPVVNDHLFPPSRKSSAGHSSSATSDTSCRIRSRKLGVNCARRRRHFFTIPEIPPFRGSSRSKGINRSNGDAKCRRSQRKVSRPCGNRKPLTSKLSSSASILTSCTALRELENLRPVSSSLIISPPTGFASPTTGHSRPSTPVPSSDVLGTIGDIGKISAPENIVVESNFVAPRTYCLDDSIANMTPLLERTSENFDVEFKNNDCFPSLISSPGSSSPSCHSSANVPASRSSEHTRPPSGQSSTLKEISDLSSQLSTNTPAASSQSPQHFVSDSSSQSNEALNRIYKESTFQPLEQSEDKTTILASGLQLSEAFAKPKEKAINSLILPKKSVLASDNISTDISETSSNACLERDYIIRSKTFLSDTINSSEVEHKIPQPVSTITPESVSIKENSVRETNKISEADNNVEVTQDISKGISNEKVQKQVNISLSNSPASLLLSKEPDTTNTPVSKSTSSELTVIPASGLDTSDSVAVLAPSSDRLEFTVPSGINKCTRSQELSAASTKTRPFREISEPIIAPSRIRLGSSFTARGRGNICKARRSLSHVSNISDCKTKSVLNTSVHASSINRNKSASSSRIVSKLPGRKETGSLKLIPQSVTTLNAKSPVSDFKHVPDLNLKLKNQATPSTIANDKLSLPGPKVSEELATDPEISKQVDLPTSDSKVISEVVYDVMPFKQQNTSAMHPDVLNHVPTFISDIKILEQDTAQSTTKASDTVITQISDQKGLHPKATPSSESKGRELKSGLQTIGNDIPSVITVKDDSIEFPTYYLESSSPTNPTNDEPFSNTTDDSESCDNYSVAALMTCLSRHDKLLRGAAARRGLKCTMPASHQQDNGEPATYKAYLRSLRKHLELVRLVCPAENTDSPCNALSNIMQPTVSELRLIPVEAAAV